LTDSTFEKKRKDICFSLYVAKNANIIQHNSTQSWPPVTEVSHVYSEMEGHSESQYFANGPIEFGKKFYVKMWVLLIFYSNQIHVKIKVRN